MEFNTDPFYLYPIEESQIDMLFIDREEECDSIQAILETEFKEICPIIGGIGTGKSSMLNYAYSSAKRLDKEVTHVEGLDEFERSVEGDLEKKDVVMIDDIDKLSDEEASKFYKKLETIIKENVTLFYTDTYQRKKETADLREFTSSQYITLPRSLNKENLNMLLEERMKNCVKDGEFSYPFDEKAVEMASIRSQGNIRRFLTYAKHAWTIYRGKEKSSLGEDDMTQGVINVDRALLGRLDLTDLKIIWNSTAGRPNKSLLAHQTDIHPKTLDNRIKEDLSGLIMEVRDGQDVFVSSIYKKLPNGKEILQQILKDLERYDEVHS